MLSLILTLCLSLTALTPATFADQPSWQQQGFPAPNSLFHSNVLNADVQACGYKKPDNAPDVPGAYFYLECKNQKPSQLFPLNDCCDAFGCQGGTKGVYGGPGLGVVPKGQCACACAMDPDRESRAFLLCALVVRVFLRRLCSVR